MTGDDIRAAAEAVRACFEPLLDRDWSASVPDLDFTVASALAHAAEGPLWYSLDIWGGPTSVEDEAFQLRVRPDASNRSILSSLLAAARTCALVVDGAPPDTRGFHPFGPTDPAAHAAMACDELLVHGDDAARGLGLRLTPDPQLAGRVLARLYPWHEVGDDPWQTLLWANGRIDLPGRPRQQRWRWHTAPLSEWDGQAPATAR